MSNTVLSQGELGNFFELRHGFAFPGSAFSDEGELLVVKIKNIKPGRLDLSKQEFIPADYLATHGGYMPKAGDLLVSLSGNRYEGNPETWVGKVCLYTGAPRCLINQRVGILRKKEGVEVDSRYFSYLLSTLDAQQSLIQIATSSGGQANLSTKQLLDFEVLVAPPADQKAIAHILGTLDEKIELNRKTNETLEEIAKALFKSWFVDFDPVRAKAEGRPTGLPAEISDLFPDSFEDSELGEIPSGWKFTPLYDLGDYINGASHSSENLNQAQMGLPVIKISELKNGITEQTRHWNHEYNSKHITEGGDILFSWSGNPDTSIGTYVWSKKKGLLNQHIFKVVPRHQAQRSYILLLLKQKQTHFAAIARDKQTTGLGHVTVKDLKETVCSYPSLPLMKAFAQMVDGFVDQCQHLILQNDSLSNIRDALLPKLISGEIRIPDAEKMLAEVDI